MVSAIIPAAGKGERMPGSEPKQFRVLGEMPVLAWSARAILAAEGVVEVVVGAAADRIGITEEILETLVGKDRVKVVPGGAERQETVKK